MPKEETKSAALVKYDDKHLAEAAGLGMSKVDPADIRPPQILLTQKMSDLDSMTDIKGDQPKIGQYFHTGKLEIYNDFEAYVLFAAKGTWQDKNHPEKGIMPKYSMIGAQAEDCAMFGMNFKSSALYTLSPLFTMAKTQKRPMFSIKVKFETKELTGDKGVWKIPVLRIIGPETDPEKLAILEDMAKSLDMRAEAVVAENEDEEIKLKKDFPF
jgi:hypothetical protein